MQIHAACTAPRRLLLSLVCFASVATSALGQSAATIPVGAVKIAIAGATAGTAATTSFVVPLTDAPLDLGRVTARITAVTADSISIQGAGWTSGAFALATQPRAVRIVSGRAAGQILPIAANTADTLTVRGPDLAALGLVSGTAGDALEIVQLDTLDSLFGATTFIGGPTPATADVVTVGAYTLDSYYYNSTAREWRRTTGRSSGNRGAIVVPPNSVIQVTRIGPAMTVTFFGRVPSIPFRAAIARAGNTHTHSGYPTDVKLRDLALQSRVPDWVSGASAATADVVSLRSGSTLVSFYHNGADWVQVAAPGTIANDRVIPAGAAIVISRSGTAPGMTALVRPLPYSL